MGEVFLNTFQIFHHPIVFFDEFAAVVIRTLDELGLVISKHPRFGREADLFGFNDHQQLLRFIKAKEIDLTHFWRNLHRLAIPERQRLDRWGSGDAQLFEVLLHDVLEPPAGFE